MPELEEEDIFANHPLIQLARQSLDIETELNGSATWRAIDKARRETEHEHMEKLLQVKASGSDEWIEHRLWIMACRLQEALIRHCLDQGQAAIQEIENGALN